MFGVFASLSGIRYSVWEKDFVKTDAYKKSEDYWITRFKDYGFEALNLPYDYTIPANKTYVGEKIFSNIPTTTFEKIEAFARKYKVSSYTVFLSALYICLYKYTKQSDIVVGSPVANRGIIGTRNIIGMFVNNVAFRAKILPNQSISTFLKYVNDCILQDLENQAYPYDALLHTRPACPTQTRHLQMQKQLLF